MVLVNVEGGFHQLLSLCPPLFSFTVYAVVCFREGLIRERRMRWNQKLRRGSGQDIEFLYGSMKRAGDVSRSARQRGVAPPHQDPGRPGLIRDRR